RTRKDAHDAESPAARRQPAATDAAEFPCGIRAPAALRFPTALRFAAALRLAAPLRIPAGLRLAAPLRIPAALRVSAPLRFPTVLWATAELLGLARCPRSGSRPGAVRLTAAAASGLRHRVRRLLAALPIGPQCCGLDPHRVHPARLASAAHPLPRQEGRVPVRSRACSAVAELRADAVPDLLHRFDLHAHRSRPAHPLGCGDR